MASDKNKLLDPPPNNTTIIKSSETGEIGQFWRNWFDNLHRIVTPKRTKITVTAASALDLDCKYVVLDSTAGGFAVTLAAPTEACVLLLIEMTVFGGNVTLSLTNVVGGSAATTCTWNSVGDTLILESRSDKWIVIKEQGVVLT